MSKTGQIYLLDSGTGQICKVNGDLLLGGMAASAEHFEIRKAVDDPSIGSKRLRDKYGITLDGVVCASRPFDFSLYAYASTLNTYHGRCIGQKAEDIAGAPWRITGDGEDSARQEHADFVDGFYEGASFTEGSTNVWTDYEAIGNGFLEVIPDRRGLAAAGAHIPSTEMWVRLDDLGFVQQKNGIFQHFRKYGLDKSVYAELKKKNTNDPLLADDITSVWHFKRYFPFSPYYGIPSIMPAWNRMALAVLECEYNLAFFNNNAIPDYAVILEGTWEDDSEQKITEYFKRHLKGKAHKTLAIRTPDGGKITFEQLTGDNAKEGSFRLLRQDCRDEVLHAHGVPPQKVGISQPGRLGTSNDEQNQNYKNSIVTPGRTKLLTPFKRILQERFPDSKFALEFEPYDTDDVQVNAEVDNTYLRAQVLTPAQVQQKRFPDLPFRPGSDQVLPLTSAGTMPDATALGDLQKRVRKALREAKQ